MSFLLQSILLFTTTASLLVVADTGVGAADLYSTSSNPSAEQSTSISSTSPHEREAPTTLGQTSSRLSSRSQPLVRSITSNNYKNNNRELIIGGHNAEQGRYPYFVALQNAQGSTECGGTLIAPDIVLTAAHCVASNLKTALVGKYWNDDQNYSDEYERIDIVNPLDNDRDDLAIVNFLRASGDAIVETTGFVHPQHNLKKRSYDVMLVKLKRPSTKPTVTVNFDPNVPQKRGGNEIVVVGMGRIEVGGSKPDILQQVYMDFLPYEECINYAHGTVDFKFELLPDMMCTLGASIYPVRGQCYGDSGGPYLTIGDSYQEDVQVGVVSWAVNCASGVFPMVGSRTSASASFIKDIACAITAVPSTPLCNPTGTMFGPKLVQVTNGVTVSVHIYSDPFPHEISWKITSPNQSLLYAQVAFGDIQNDHDFRVVDLPPGQDFIFYILDAADDGILSDVDAVAYEIVLTEQGKDIVLLAGDGAFSTDRTETFRVPTHSEVPGLMVRPPESGARPFTSDTDAVLVRVFFDFGDYHDDLAWSITDALDESNVFVSKGFATYRYGDHTTEEIYLPVGRYHFIIQDRRGTDEYRAFHSYQISYRNKSGEMIPILESQGVLAVDSSTQEFKVPALEGSTDSSGNGEGQVSTINSSSDSIRVCVDFGLPCQGFSDCCSGRCASGICRTSTANPRRQRNRIGAANGRGGASRNANGK
ncbi:trypsin [Nitzschia inconspicua]|uniref:Trypsin n=1 Tax=Nitzschia inconspicua TaxID=303405 RepID=A0A9K3M0H8_9STRA|nr:trypsin [Nitzschia inconspicua]